MSVAAVRDMSERNMHVKELDMNMSTLAHEVETLVPAFVACPVSGFIMTWPFRSNVSPFSFIATFSSPSVTYIPVGVVPPRGISAPGAPLHATVPFGSGVSWNPAGQTAAYAMFGVARLGAASESEIGVAIAARSKNANTAPFESPQCFLARIIPYGLGHAALFGASLSQHFFHTSRTAGLFTLHQPGGIDVESAHSFIVFATRPSLPSIAVCMLSNCLMTPLGPSRSICWCSNL